MGSPPVGRLLAACLAARPKPDPARPGEGTGIGKREVAGPVRLHALGVDGDHVMDTENHGGRDKAVYAYAAEDRSWWAERLGRELAPGAFGENLVTEGIDVTGAVVGQRWRIGSGPEAVVVEVSEPRIPCRTFQAHLGEERWVRRFTEQGRPGAYLRVVQEGFVAAGDPVEVVSTPAHGVTVGELRVIGDADPARLQRLVDGQPDLAVALERVVRRRLRVAG